MTAQQNQLPEHRDASNMPGRSGKLEAIRGFAAAYVVIHHLVAFTDIRFHLTPLWRMPFRFGQEAVILFFLMSGFVICLSLLKKPISAKTYIMRRALRIYPLFLLSAVISLVLYGKAFNRGIIDLRTFAGNFVMLQDVSNKPGQWFDVFGGNDPLWSLSYEWWFYMIFFPAMALFLRSKSSSPKIRLSIILGVSLVSWFCYLANPNHAALIGAYLYLWWVGVFFAEIFANHGRITFHQAILPIVGLVIMTSATAIPLLTSPRGSLSALSPFDYPFINPRHYFAATVFVTTAFLWSRFQFRGFSTFLQPFAILAPISYGLYITHFPLVLVHFPGISNPFISGVMKLLIIGIVAYLAEAKLQPMINNLVFTKRVP